MLAWLLQAARGDRLPPEPGPGRTADVLDALRTRGALFASDLITATGARLGEVLKARWSDIDLERGVWTKPSHHTKQKRTEHIPLSGPALVLLAEMQSKANSTEESLFPGNVTGRPLQDIKKFWKAVITEAEISEYRLHDNRHTHASHLVSSGLSLEIVGRLLGHTNPTTTKRYAHIADSPLRAATERFGAKLDALHEGREAEIVPLKWPR